MAGMKNRSILWYRQDLRMHDNEALYEAVRFNHQVIPVYVFDVRLFHGISRFRHRRVHPLRARFIVESVKALRQSWREMGGDLIVRVGKPEEIIFSLAGEFKTSMVYCNRERTRDEVQVQDRLEHNLWSIGQEMRCTRGKMLYYTQDLPFPVPHTPDQFSAFRKELERIIPVRNMLEIPETMHTLNRPFDAGDIPEPVDFGLGPERGMEPLFSGGEKEGIRRMKEYIWSDGGLKKYRAKDNFLNNALFSSSLSPWLAQGCISPKMVYHEVKSYESIFGPGEASQNLLTELIRRDYCRMITNKYGDKIFQRGGILKKPVPQVRDEAYLFNLWKEGRTGVPLVDSAMKALRATGYLPHPLREAVARFLVSSLKVNWQLGADWFEANLVDYDAASNWVNWLLLAGQMPESGEEKAVSLTYLAKKYDPTGQFIRKWLKELEGIPGAKILRPETLSMEEQVKYGFTPGKNYPKPIVPLG